MKVLLFLPFPPDSPTGNAVTARRIRRYLAPLGIEVVFEHLSAQAGLDRVLAAIDREGPDVLQWYNAWKTGRWLPEVKGVRAPPSVITLTGTDIYREAEDDEHRERILATLRDSDAIVTYSDALRDRAVSLLPEVAEKIHTIPKGVDLGTAQYDLPAWATGDVVLFLLPAGIRPEKNNRFAVRALDAVHAENPRVRLLLAGPVLDPSYAAELQNDLATRPWAGHIENIPHEAMASVYSQAAVVLNTSLSEGLANAVIEAMACGRPVLAADIEGNRQVIKLQDSGLLFGNVDEFQRWARRLAVDEGFRERLGSQARMDAKVRWSAVAEAEALKRVFDFLRPSTLDPRSARPEPPLFEGIGPIAEARTDTLGSDHATYLLASGIARDRAHVSEKVVWEVGCGSGYLAALCAKLGAREVWATDVDERALALASETARLNQVRLHLAKASLMELAEDVQPDIVIANLPQKPVPANAKIAIANDGGEDGARLLRPFLVQAGARLRRGARLYLFLHSLATPVLQQLRSDFEIRSTVRCKRIFYEDEFPQLLPYWRSRRNQGLCMFDDLGDGRHAFLCSALTCVRR